MLLSELLGSVVVDRSGRRLGVVHDVAAVQDGAVTGAFGAALRVEALLVGSWGVWARLGLSPAHVRGPRPVRALSRLGGRGRTIPWSAVESVAPGRVVVDAGGLSRDASG